MKKKNWSKQMNERFNRVLKITNSISDLYNSLFDLEVKKEKDSDEYQKKLSYLNMALDIEKKIYNELSLSQEEKKLWQEHIYRLFKNKEFMINLDSIITQYYTDHNYRRIYNHLIDFFLYDKCPEDEILIHNDLKTKGFNDNEIKNRSDKINRTIQKDLMQGYLYFLNQEMHKPEYKSLSTYFIYSKYYISFIDSEIEKDMINNNFNQSNKYYLESRFISDCAFLNSNVFDNLKDSYGFQLAKYGINSLLAYEDKDYQSDFICSSALIIQCLIKAGLSLTSDDIYKEIKKGYEKYLNSNEYQNENLNNFISVHLIDTCLNNYQDNKNKVLIVSTKTFGNVK